MSTATNSRTALISYTNRDSISGGIILPPNAPYNDTTSSLVINGTQSTGLAHVFGSSFRPGVANTQRTVTGENPIYEKYLINKTIREENSKSYISNSDINVTMGPGPPKTERIMV